MLKSVRHNIVLVRGVRKMLTKDDEGVRKGKPKGNCYNINTMKTSLNIHLLFKTNRQRSEWVTKTDIIT